MTDVLLSILLLFFSWSWGESSSHTEFVKHRKKQFKKKLNGLTWSHVDSSCMMSLHFHIYLAG